MSDVKAGGAFIELFMKDSFGPALAGAHRKLASFAKSVPGMLGSAAEGMKSLGKGMLGGGAGILAPIGMAMKSFGSFAEEMSKVRSSTGLSLDAIAGLKFAAEDAGIPFEAVATAVRKMNIAIQDPKSADAQALKNIGLDAKTLKGLSVDEQVGAIANAIAAVEDPGKRAAFSVRALGRNGELLLPILENGSAGLKESAQQARRFGLALDEGALKKGLATDQALDNVSHAFKGLVLSIGKAASAFVPLIERLAGIITQAGKWIELNPDMIERAGQLGLAMVGVGTAFFVVGAAISAALSPAFMATAAITGLAATVLAVTDTLGITKTGFGDLFNSIRIDGTGLGTWLSALFLEIGEMFWSVVDTFSAGFDLIFAGFQEIENFKARNWADAVGGIAGGLGKLGVKETDEGFLGGIMRRSTQYSKWDKTEWGSEFNKALDAQDDRSAKARERQAATQKRIQELFVADPQTGEGGISFDPEKAKQGILKISDSISGAVDGALEKIADYLGIKLPEVKARLGNEFGDKKPGPQIPGPPEAYSVFGTFSARAAEGAGANIQRQQLDEAKKHSHRLERIQALLEGMEGGLA